MEVAFVTLTEIVRALFVASLMFKPHSHHASNKVCRVLSSTAVFYPAIHGPYANQHLTLTPPLLSVALQIAPMRSGP